MVLHITTHDKRLSRSANKTTIALFGLPGVGKTSLLRGLPADKTLCVDLEAGLKSVQDWRGPSIPIRCYEDAVDLACMIGGPNPGADPQGYFSRGHYQHLITANPDLVPLIADTSIIFVDSLTDLTRQALDWARMQPEAFSERSRKPDTRSAYGLMAREVITLLKHLQHAPGKTVITVGVLEKVTDEFGKVTWQPQIEGGKVGRELPGIVDQVISMALFSRHSDGTWQHDPDRGTERRFVCKANPFGLPGKDRSGRLDETEPPDLAALLHKINAIINP
jgi:hypothetical protein